MKRKCVFLDRDGVINKKAPEGDYIKNWSEFYFLPDVFKAIKILKENEFLIIIVTNQRCISKRIITKKGLEEIHEKMVKEIRNFGGDIDAIYFCPHDIADNCDCRKPKPGMLLNAIKDFKSRGIEIDLGESYMIGDSEDDIIAGRALKLKTIKIGEFSKNTDTIKKNLLEAIKEIILND